MHNPLAVIPGMENDTRSGPRTGEGGLDTSNRNRSKYSLPPGNLRTFQGAAVSERELALFPTRSSLLLQQTRPCASKRRESACAYLESFQTTAICELSSFAFPQEV